MSKEIQCKCCKEYWWEMNIHSQSGLCPNCYDYVADLETKLEQYEKFMKDNEWDSIEEMQTTLNECEKKYFDMQQQLAEIEKESNDYVMSAIERYDDLTNRITQAQKERELDNIFWKQECDSLQKALAEKEKSLEYFRDRLGKADKEIKKIYKEYNEAVEDYNNLKEEVEVNFVDGKVCDQAKTDFAIEKLEKVKEFLFSGYAVDNKEIEKEIDQQIKALKHEDKGE